MVCISKNIEVHDKTRGMDSELRNTSYDSVQDEFCSPTKSSVEGSLHYLQQELQMLGLPSLLSEGAKQLETSRVINVTHQLLQLHRHNLKIIDELKDSLQRGRSDVQFQNETQARLKDEVKASRREIALLEDRERQLNDKIKEFTAKLRTEQEEVKRLKLSMQYKQSQRAHESKKREKEYERLKQRLGQLVSGKNRDRCSGLNMLNTVQRTDGKRKAWTKPGSGDVEMYQVIVGNYDERQKEIMIENASLRESLYNLHKHLITMLNNQQEPKEVDECNEPTCYPDDADRVLLSSGHFQMPYDVVRDGIEESFKKKCKLLVEHIDCLKMKIEELKRCEAEGGHNQVQESDDGEDAGCSCSHRESHASKACLYQNQENTTMHSTHTHQKQPLSVESSEDVPVLSDSFVWREQSKLKTEMDLFLEQRKDFEKEKQQFMEAVCRLDRERRTFEDEKAAFLSEQLRDVSFLNTSKELDSFFMTASSTPAQSTLLSKRKVMHTESSTKEVDLQHDLSLCSDDGTSVLNERPEINVQEESSDQD